MTVTPESRHCPREVILKLRTFKQIQPILRKLQEGGAPATSFVLRRVSHLPSVFFLLFLSVFALVSCFIDCPSPSLPFLPVTLHSLITFSFLIFLFLYYCLVSDSLTPSLFVLISLPFLSSIRSNVIYLFLLCSCIILFYFT